MFPHCWILRVVVVLWATVLYVVHFLHMFLWLVISSSFWDLLQNIFFLLILIKFRPLIIDSQTFNIVTPTLSPESRSAPFSSDVIFPDLCFFVFISILFCSSICLIFLPCCLDYCNFGHIVLKDQNCQIWLCFLKCWVGCLELYMCLNTL